MTVKQFDLVVWDWDGTIADSTGMITQALIRAAEETGLPPLTTEKVRGIIGLGLRESIHALYGDIPQTLAQGLATAYQRRYYAGENEIVLFEGIAETIAALARRGCKQAVATGKGRRGLDAALANTGLGRYFSATKTVDECFSKPHPQMLDELMDEIGLMYEGEVEYELKSLSANIEPILIVTLGVMVLILALGIFLPIWDLGRVAMKR